MSIGSGTVPAHKREKSMSSYMDTGNVLIESACSVDRVDAALSTVGPLIPDFKYFRQEFHSFMAILLNIFECHYSRPWSVAPEKFD